MHSDSSRQDPAAVYLYIVVTGRKIGIRGSFVGELSEVYIGEVDIAWRTRRLM